MPRMTRGSRRSRDAAPQELGAVVITFSLAMALVVGMVVAALVLGRQAIARHDLQNAADAAALACANSVEQHGLNRGRIHDPRVYQAYIPANTWLRSFNAICTPYAWNNVHPTRKENRNLVAVQVASRLDTEQTWFSPRFLNLSATAFAQVNEMVFGDPWPVLIFNLDGSESMTYTLPAAAGRQAFDVMRDLITEYVKNTFPVRNGVVVFNDTVVASVAPSTGNVSNKSSIITRLKGISPAKQTNTHSALRRTRQMFQSASFKGRKNVIVISDGEPTKAAGCADKTKCCFDKAEAEARTIRNTYKATILAVEIRRTNYFTGATRFLEGIAGEPNKPGGAKGPVYQVSSMITMKSFMIALSSTICSFVLQPGEAAPPDTLRPRPGNPRLTATNRRRVYAYLRDEKTGMEKRIPYVPNATYSAGQPGFSFQTDGNESMVILTQASCNEMGKNPDHRLVVRWDDAMLVPPPI